MRKSLPLVLATALAIVLVGCAEDPRDVTAGVSGNAPPPATEPTLPPQPTTTAPPAEQIVDIPDVSDLGLTWDEEPAVDADDGTVNTGAFNQYLRAEAPNAMLAPGTFDDVDPADPEDRDEAAGLLAAALPEGPARTIALFLGLDPDDTDTQMLVRASGQPGTAEVVVVQLVDGDDSVRAVRWAFRVEMESRAGFADAEEITEQAAEGFDGDAVEALEGDTESVAEDDGSTEEEIDTQSADPLPDIIPVVYGGTRTFQCQPGRGQQDFAVALCQ